MALEFDEWLVGLLRQRGMSQKELADAVNVTPAAVNAWANGRSVPRYEKIAAIAAALEVGVEDAVNRRNPKSSPADLEWVFQKAPDDGSRTGGNAAAYAFAANLEVLAREATQNSLDERYEQKLPVTARFVLHELTGSHLRKFLSALRWDSIEGHLREAADRRQKAGRVLVDGLNELDRTGRLFLLRIDDYNAAGLTGPEYEDGRFARVVRRTLDSGKAGSQGGSYGLGKAALWAASRFGLVLVNSTLSQKQDGRDERRMAGRLELPWHALNGEEFAGPAWFGTQDKERSNSARSWWADRATAESLYLERSDDSPGTSFLVVGAYDGSGDTEDLEEMYEQLAAGLAHNFWASMVAGGQSGPLLRASVAAWRNGQVVRHERDIDPHVHEPAKSRAVKAFLDGRTTSELTSRDDVLQASVKLRLPAMKLEEPRSGGGNSGTHEAVLLVTPTSEDDPKPDRISFMRASRMVVKEKKVTDLPLGHRRFQAILLAGVATGGATPEAEAAERFLRTAEPPDHNDWTSTEDLTATYVRGARQAILDFKKAADHAVRELLRGQEEESDSDDGPQILRELLTLDAPKKARAQGFPSVHSVEGSVSESGSWHVRVTIKLPARDEPWVLAPVARFVVQSGGNIPVEWAGTLVPERNCELTRNGNILFRGGATRGVFRGVTDASTHPVAANMSCIEVDVPRAKEVVA